MEKIDNAQGSALDITSYQSAINNHNIKSAWSWSLKSWQVKQDRPGDSILPRCLFFFYQVSLEENGENVLSCRKKEFSTVLLIFMRGHGHIYSNLH